MNDSETQVEFGELPPDQRLSAQLIADQLRDRPGEWAKVATKPGRSTASGMAMNIKLGRTRAYEPAGAFDAVIRGCDVWARYVGEQS